MSDEERAVLRAAIATEIAVYGFFCANTELEWNNVHELSDRLLAIIAGESVEKKPGYMENDL